ncbi:UDP-glucose dehydrogenase family protein [Mumia sp. Pv 4-285]|uniref:UDP-glucose dehydrogenase family protein n=1 Tax=Mumia qirimensis TaxID=3234852 RepID=UPI00351D093A
MSRTSSDHPDSGVQVCVIGTGYVGLTAGACLAYLGHRVTCADASADRVAALRRGTIPIYEAGLDELVEAGASSGRLSFVTSNLDAVHDADVVFLCLPTPQDADGSADLSRVLAVAAEIGASLKEGAVVVNKSTVPVGTAARVAEALGRPDVHVVSNPEFLAEGSAVRDFLNPDRVVVGSDDASAAERVAALYAPLDARTVVTDVASAETIKYASNAYLAIRLTFVNSMAAVCEASGADIRAVTEGMGADRRIGTAFLKPGPGWGGSCFPKDTAALVRTSEEHGFDFSLLRAAVDANAQHRRWLLGKIVGAVGGDVRGRRVALWGLTFKAGTDDLRDSPALELAHDLVALGAQVRAYDPTVTTDVDGIDVARSALAACEDADVLAIGTEWPEFSEVDLSEVASALAGDVVVDCRNVLDAPAAAAAGLLYTGVGLRGVGVVPTSAAVDAALDGGTAA